MFDMQLVTVWSAPNYCYRCGNKASILTIHEDGEQSFTVYGAAEENERDKGLQTRRMVSHQVFFHIVASHLRPVDLEQHAVFCLKIIHIPYHLLQRNITVVLDQGVPLERSTSD